jgi:hypothetical protein
MPLRFDDRAYMAWYVTKRLDETPPGSSVWGTISGYLTAQTDLIQYIADHGGGGVWGAITGTLLAQTDLASALGGKADTGHGHAQSDVTGLVTALAGKEPANSNIQTHVTSAHAPSNAQKNSDITKAEIEAKLTGEISTHTHAGGGGGLTHGQVMSRIFLGG